MPLWQEKRQEKEKESGHDFAGAILQYRLISFRPLSNMMTMKSIELDIVSPKYVTFSGYFDF